MGFRSCDRNFRRLPLCAGMVRVKGTNGAMTILDNTPQLTLGQFLVRNHVIENFGTIDNKDTWLQMNNDLNVSSDLIRRISSAMGAVRFNTKRARAQNELENYIV
jgi:capsule polysaccharide modification protein KpsS